MKKPDDAALWRLVVFVAWGILALVVSIRAFAAPERRTVYPVYMRAADNWIAGRNLYDGGIDFRYSPPIAASFVPLYFLPLRIGAALWRILNVAALLGALAWWMRCAPFATLQPHRKALLFLLVIPLAANAINNGQINPLLAALLVAATVAISRDRTLIACACIVLATFVKVYPLVLGLLLALCFPRRMILRLLLVGAAGIAISLFLRNPSYVVARYAEWIHALRTDYRELWSVSVAPTDIRLMLRLWWDTPPRWMYGALQALTGLSVAGLCLWMRLRKSRLPLDDGQFCFRVLGLASCWMLLFGPATESNTFVLVAPAAALLLVWPATGRLGRGVWLVAVVGYGTVVSSQILGWFPFAREVQSAGIAPMGTLLIFIAFIASAFVGLDESKEAPAIPLLDTPNVNPSAVAPPV